MELAIWPMNFYKPIKDENIRPEDFGILFSKNTAVKVHSLFFQMSFFIYISFLNGLMT